MSSSSMVAIRTRWCRKSSPPGRRTCGSWRAYLLNLSPYLSVEALQQLVDKEGTL